MRISICGKPNATVLAASFVLAALAAAPALAGENGNIQYAPGSSGFYAGAIPPMPGLYALSQTSYTSSDRLNDGNGDKLPVNFDLDVKVETIRLLGVTDWQVGGGQYFWQLVMPMVLDLDVGVAGHDGSDSGLADITVSSGFAWHKGPHTYVVGLDVAAPSGSYDMTSPANAGVNHWSIQPTIGYHYIDFRQPDWEFGAIARYIRNFKNSDTNYTSGDEIVVDYAVGKYFGPVRAGVVGYFLQQVTDDKGAGVAADGNRARGIAIGPSLTYNFNPGTQLGISWQKDIVSENRSQGDTWQIAFSTKF